MLVDSHCHFHLLDLSNSDDTVDAVIERAHANGVKYFLCVSTELSEYDTLVSYAEKYPDVSFSVGVHPNNHPGQNFTEADILPLTKHDKMLAIGETGLDYFRSEGDLSWQQERFITHINLAKKISKPLIIHTRAAKDDTVRIMRQENAEVAPNTVIAVFQKGYRLHDRLVRSAKVVVSKAVSS